MLGAKTVGHLTFIFHVQKRSYKWVGCISFFLQVQGVPKSKNLKKGYGLIASKHEKYIHIAIL